MIELAFHHPGTSLVERKGCHAIEAGWISKLPQSPIDYHGCTVILTLGVRMGDWWATLQPPGSLQIFEQQQQKQRDLRHA